MSETPENVPRHVAVIMDGNGRWAHERGLPRTEGHRAGAESARALARCCVEWGIPYLTLYAFSTENWNRPAAEVRFLMSNLRRFLSEHRAEFVENDIRFRAIGVVEELPKGVRRQIRLTEEATAECKSLDLLVALNYGSRREIADAARAIAVEVAAGRLGPEQIGPETVDQHLYTAGIPAPDLLIRTGGEMRLSNFLLWQLSYAELYVTDTLWPDFDQDRFREALEEFSRRERRFGAVRQVDRGAEPQPDKDAEPEPSGEAEPSGSPAGSGSQD